MALGLAWCDLSRVKVDGRRGVGAGVTDVGQASGVGQKEDLGRRVGGREKFNKRVWSSTVGR